MKRVRQINIKVFTPGNRSFKALHLHAPKKKMFTEGGIQGILARIADEIERERPLDDYELKELPGNQFNFVWKGFKPVDAPVAVGDQA